MEGGKALQFLHHFGSTIGGPYPHKEVQVIGLNCQCENISPLFLALLAKKVL